jgi:hypothetical protein
MCAKVLDVLQSESPAVNLSDADQRSFFANFHGAHIHLYHLDRPLQSPKSNGLLTAPAGLYVVDPSDLGYLNNDSNVQHEKKQEEAPRILLAVFDAAYSPLLPMPTTMLASELHPWNTALHTVKIPYTVSSDLENLTYLMPRYSQPTHSRCRLSCSHCATSSHVCRLCFAVVQRVSSAAMAGVCRCAVSAL